MRSPNLDSTTPLETDLPKTTPPQTVDYWFVTERGLRASGAASMQATAARLRQAAKELEAAASRLDQDVPAPTNGSAASTPGSFRRGTVCGRYRHHSRVPDLRLSGKWLRNAGFELGQKYQVKVADGRLTICAE